MSKRVSLGLAAILVVYAAVFARTVGYDFVWDDVVSIRDSPLFDRPLLEGLTTTEHARQDPAVMALKGIAPNHESYRPVVYASHAFDVAAFGRTPGPMHAHNLLLGALAVAVAFALGRRWLNGDPGGLALAALTALHPLHVEPTAYISGRSDLLAGLLSLLCCLCLDVALSPGAQTVAQPSRRRSSAALGVAVACLFQLASLFTKEGNVGLPFALAAFALATGRLRAWRWGLGALAAITVVYFGLRATLTSGAPGAVAGIAIPQAVRELPGLTLQYLIAFLLPFDLSIERPLRTDLVMVGWIVVLAICVLTAIALRRWQGPPRRAVALAFAGLVGATALLAPAAIAVRSMGAVADRYAYFAVPLFGVAVIGPVLALELPAGIARRTLAATAALWGLLLLATTALQVPAWRDNRALYVHAVTMEPTSSMAHYRIGYLLAAEGRWADAAAAFQRAVALDAHNERALNNLGVAYLNMGRLDDAEKQFRAVLAVSDGTKANSWFNLASVHLARGDRARACADLQRALAISPLYARARAQFDQLCRPPGAPSLSPNLAPSQRGQ